MVKHCLDCNVELDINKNWYKGYKRISHYRCKKCGTAYQKRTPNYDTNNTENNKLQMYVNGKYVSRKHPLYKPGKYKTFSDAAFSSLINYVKCVKGEVYIISNPAWKSWYKIGKAVDSEDRCNGYQTSSPHRDYSIVSKISVSNRGMGEKIAHSLAEGMSRERSNEWFRIENLEEEDFDKFLSLVKTLTEEKVNGGVSTNKKSAR